MKRLNLDRLKEKIDRWIHPNKLKEYHLKFPRHMKLPKNIVVLASNEEDALLMRRYLIDEGFEGWKNES